ncbi:MAG TPA: efflux RND transporter periplasmic adaptor subunit [Candidatus Limnocylindrales bacterium]|nr:efflux RND transporter periplasmic adaptor subunit [Candidatus Limnocylindrales bacterium]
MNTESNDRQTTTAESPVPDSPNPAAPAVAAAQPAAAPPLPSARISWWIPASAVAVVALVVFFGIRSRVNAEANVTRVTHEAAIPTVSVVHPVADAPSQEIALPGNTTAFIDAPIYARTNGYLKRWYFDIGSSVKKGQLLAEIETPELDQQLQQARADLETAQANYNIAKITASRWEFLVSTGSVSQQETDQARSDLTAKKAAADSSASNVRRLEELQSFEKIYAPFDGILTARNTDVGQLIDAGASAPKELFHLASINKLRVYVAIPEVYSRAASNGATATLTLDEFPGEIFKGTLVRNANAFDAANRTLLTEVDVDNPNGRLRPGAYVFVHFKLPESVTSVTIPANTLLFRKEGLQVGVVRDGKVQLVSVKMGRDYGNIVEILSGLSGSDSVVLSPPDSLLTGTPVKIANQHAGD